MVTSTNSGTVMVDPSKAMRLLKENGTLDAIKKYMKPKKEINNNMKFEVYSKDNCIYCTKIKDLLNHHGLSYEEKSLSAGFTKEEIQERVGEDKKINTVPQVFVDGNYLGGYLDVVEFLAYDKHLA